LLSGEFLGAAGQAVGLTTLRIASNSPDERFDAGLVAGKPIRCTADNRQKHRLAVRSRVLAKPAAKRRPDLDRELRAEIEPQLRGSSTSTTAIVCDFRHDLTFGRPASATRPAPRPRETVVSLQLTGAGTDEGALLSRLTLHQGDRFNFFRWQDDRERIERYYHDRGRFEARVVTRRTVDAADSRRVSLTYDVRPGPRTTMRLSGFMLSSSTIREIERAGRERWWTTCSRTRS
jgi:outer membrane translocation and assembly module TamA